MQLSSKLQALLTGLHTYYTASVHTYYTTSVAYILHFDCCMYTALQVSRSHTILQVLPTYCTASPLNCKVYLTPVISWTLHLGRNQHGGRHHAD